jgi:outer membrane protein OmpA-like peptidoglycan-associated protein
MIQLRYTILVAICFLLSIEAQAQANIPWRYGANLGLNYNMTGIGLGNWASSDVGGSSFRELVVNDGNAIGIYGGLSAQYNFAEQFGLLVRLSYDGRNLFAQDAESFPGRVDEFTFNNSYVHLEPSLLFYPVTDAGFHLRAGLGVGLALGTDYDYTIGVGGQNLTRTGVPNDMAATIAASGHLGFGYDINLTNTTDVTQWFLTPFVEASYFVGQRGVDFEEQGGFDDAMSTVTIRAGVGISFGKNTNVETPPSRSKLFRVEPPEDGIYAKSIVDVSFPIRPFVFFDRNNTAIPTSSALGSRYVLLDKGDVNDWDVRAEFTAEDLANVKARPFNLKEVYYNILNIAGSRLRKNPTVTLNLIGSDPIEKNGEELAKSVKQYLVDVWSIDANRITVTGQLNPRIPSGTARTPAEDMPMVDMENRRVELVYSDPKLGERVRIRAEREATDENFVFLEITTNESIASWTTVIAGNGQRKTYGPFTELDAFLDPTGLLGASQSAADFTAEVIATTTDGRTLTETETFTLTRSSKDATAERHSLNFEYAEADPVKRSETFLRGDVANRIAPNSLVSITGFTDVIGKDDVNLKLSQSRGKEVKDMLSNELQKRGKRARISSLGYGEGPKPDTRNVRQFPDDLPEGRMYNRTVVIDLIPR